jgi:hypothetical protein
LGQSGSVRQSDTGTVGTVRQSGCPIFSISLNLNDRVSDIIFFQLGGCLNDQVSDIGMVLGQSGSVRQSDTGTGCKVGQLESRSTLSTGLGLARLAPGPTQTRPLRARAGSKIVRP